MSTPDTIEAKIELFNKRVDAWVAWAENPDTIQATSLLKNYKTGGQCCLGGLCQIAGLEEKRNDRDEHTVYVGPVRGDFYDTTPPECVANSVGIKPIGLMRFDEWQIPDGIFVDGRAFTTELWKELEPNEMYRTLIDLNDARRFTLADIAKVIRHNRERMLNSITGTGPLTA